MQDCAAPHQHAADPPTESRQFAPNGGRTDRCLDPEEFLRAELDRTYALLAQAVRYAAHHTGVDAGTLIQTFADTLGVRLEEPAWRRARDRRRLRFLLRARTLAAVPTNGKVPVA